MENASKRSIAAILGWMRQGITLLGAFDLVCSAAFRHGGCGGSNKKPKLPLPSLPLRVRATSKSYEYFKKEVTSIFMLGCVCFFPFFRKINFFVEVPHLQLVCVIYVFLCSTT